MFSDACSDAAAELIRMYLHYKIGLTTFDSIYPKKDVMKVLEGLYYLVARSDLQKYDGSFPDEKALRKQAKQHCKRIIRDISI